MGTDLLQRVVDALDVDVGADAGFASDGSIRREVADHMSCAVLEAWIRAVRVHGPSEDGPIEGGRRFRIVRGDAQVGDPGASENSRFAVVSWHEHIVARDALAFSQGP